MENLNQSMQSSKKIFLRKDMQPERLGEEIYTNDILSQYSVYLMRKFEEQSDYSELDQMEILLDELPELFRQQFQDIVIKKVYARPTQKAVYVTLFLALPQPLNKPQINNLKSWMETLEVPVLEIEHVSSFNGASSSGVALELQETNSEVLLLTEMMNQFSENMTEIYAELQAVKNKKAPPVVKVVKSEAVTRHSLEKENETKLQFATEKMDKLAKEFVTFQKQVNQKLEQIGKPKKPPRFKIFLGSGERQPTLESRLEDAVKKITHLTNQVEFSQDEVAKLSVQVEKAAQMNNQKQLTTRKRTTSDEESKLQEKLAVTSEEVSTISRQLRQIDEKLSSVETKVLKSEPSQEEIARIKKDHGQLQENTSETVKLNQIINELTEKLKTVENEVTTAKKKKPPVMRLAKNDSLSSLDDQHRKDQEQLKANAVEIKKLTQTVGKVDVQLIQAHQKIAELEQRVRHQSTVENNSSAHIRPIGQSGEPLLPQNKQVNFNHPPQSQVQSGQAQSNQLQPNQLQPNQLQPSQPQSRAESVQERVNRNFPTKEAFLQASRPLGRQNPPSRLSQQQTQVLPPQNQPMRPVDDNQPTVTLAIEEMLDRVSSHPKQSGNSDSFDNASTGSTLATSSLRRLKKIEWDIVACFQKSKGGIGYRGMVGKEDFYSNIRQIEVLPYLWSTVYERIQHDLILGNELSCQQLIDNLPAFLEELEEMASKRKVMGKWVYCPKEVEQKMEGYKLLNEYFETYIANDGNR